MADVIFVVVALGFFGLCVVYVRGLDRVVSSAEESTDTVEPVDVIGEDAR